MAATPELSEDERNALLRSLTEVGPSKPVGYLPLNTIENIAQLDPETVAAAARARGLATEQFAPSGCCIKSGALYIYHREALAALLRANADAVHAAGLPLDPGDFVARIASVWFEQNHPARLIIAIAFGEGA